MGKSCSGMSSAVFRTGLRAPHVVLGGALVPAGTVLVTPGLSSVAVLRVAALSVVVLSVEAQCGSTQCRSTLCRKMCLLIDETKACFVCSTQCRSTLCRKMCLLIDETKACYVCS